MGAYAPSMTGMSAPARTWATPDIRRTLQLVLAAIWLLDGVLQLQTYFFTKAFGGQFIPAVAAGNPSFIAKPITWAGAQIDHHAVLADSLFALVQIAIGFGIAWRPTRKYALGASIVWAIGVWWLGEGLGGVLNGVADPVNGRAWRGDGLRAPRGAALAARRRDDRPRLPGGDGPRRLLGEGALARALG